MSLLRACALVVRRGILVARSICVTVAHDIAQQIAGGDARIAGAMLESHLHAGRQDLVPGRPLRYGVSITDACLSWEHTAPLIEAFAGTVDERRARASQA